MEITSLMNRDETKNIRLLPNRVVSIRSREVRIDCLAGAVMITWPDCHEQILKSGQSLSVLPQGKLCILSLGPAAVQLLAKGRSIAAMAFFTPRSAKVCPQNCC